MYNYLGEVTVDNPILGHFEATVQQKFPGGSKGLYLTDSLLMVLKCTAKAESTSATHYGTELNHNHDFIRP